jgi:imidazolonepropionase-like amidohydrolase
MRTRHLFSAYFSYYFIQSNLTYFPMLSFLPRLFSLFLLFCYSGSTFPQSAYVLKPERVFDGEALHAGWWVVVQGDKIIAVGNSQSITAPAGAQMIELPGTTLLPGLIEGHSHLFLHPYNETSWDDQVLREPRAERTARAVVHAEKTLLAGFTTVRDLGTEGVDYDDVGLKQAIDKGIIPGPRMLVATRALVATGSYGPKGFVSEMNVPQGAEEVSGSEAVIAAVRRQIGKGAALIKVYADYRWGLNGETQPTFHPKN